ncbi:hypothetical protein [Mycobacterium sp. BK086]|uniref:hypothetical protein n=1 Tax=Mycobacterium sp. BK086 TaxID=2512165 RepID=UPI001061914A|nr:hypothetical protein [Mycobacterium sp. BK086]
MFDAPLVNPSPNGLFGATRWQEDEGPLRWLKPGVDVRVFNYGGEGQFGVWEADVLATADDLDDAEAKRGERPEFPDTFVSLTSWAADECMLGEARQAESRVRASQVFRLQEPNAVEAAVAARLLDDAGTPADVDNLVAAVGYLEAKFAQTNTLGLIHASAKWAAPAAQAQLVVRTNSVLKTPLGHTWVFGGGYVDTLDDTLVATSPTFGWRGTEQLYESNRVEVNMFRAIVERSVLVGFEALVGAAEIGS